MWPKRGHAFFRAQFLGARWILKSDVKIEMDFLEWDADKADRNLVKHGLDFLVAVELFDGRQMVTVPSVRSEELRYLFVCVREGDYITTIWTWRGDVRRIISMRRARNVEKQAYQKVFGG